MPEGFVGVSEVCVLGLNKNQGEEILLRLRTDDFTGFRKHLTIRKVLFHELAHNQHSDHGDGFQRLMRQVESEAIALLGPGQILGGVGVGGNSRCRSNGTERTFQAWAGSGKVSEDSENPEWRLKAASEMSARAAAERMAAESQSQPPSLADRNSARPSTPIDIEIEAPYDTESVMSSGHPHEKTGISTLVCSCCGDLEEIHAPQRRHCLVCNSEAKEVRGNGFRETSSPYLVQVGAQIAQRGPNLDAEPNSGDMGAASEAFPSPCPMGRHDGSDEDLPIERLTKMGFSQESVRAVLSRLREHGILDEERRQGLALELLLTETNGAQLGSPMPPPPVHATAAGATSGASHKTSADRESRIARAAAALCEQGMGAAETADTLVGVLSQIMEDPGSAKWRRLRPANRRFQRTIGEHAHALELLTAVGFECEETSRGVSGQNDSVLILKRDDPGLLWLGISHIQKWRPLLC